MAYEIPWLKHLPEDAQREFYEEILAISIFSHNMGTPTSDYVEKINVCLASWRATAEAWADPELREILTTPSEGDHGDVPPPDSGCCLERSVCEHAVPAPPLPRRRAQAPRKLCPSNCPDPTRDDSAHWCDLTAGHTGAHRSRHGHTWTDEDARRTDVSSRNTALEALKNFPEPRHGE